MSFIEDVLDQNEKMIFSLRSLYKKYGYTRYRMGKFEEYDLYSRNKDFLVSDSIITFTDTNGKLMALKPDVTLSIIKNNKDMPDTVQKLYYNESVYRISKGTNTFKEIMQTGLECIGKIDSECIGEVLMLAAESLNTRSPDFVLEVSNLEILSVFVENVTNDISLKKSILKCVSEKNSHGILEICKTNDIPIEKAEPLVKLLSVYGAPNTVFKKLREIIDDEVLLKQLSLFEQALNVFEDTELSKHIRIDFSVVGDIKYYNGVVFKGFIDGVPGSVLSGGQYDKLMKKMGRKSKAIGFAVYLDMLERINSTFA